MSNNSPKSILEGLGLRFAALEARAKAVDELTHTVRGCLEPQLGVHIISASYRNDVLILMTDSAAWCAELRFREEELRSRLATAGQPAFRKLRVRVGAPAESRLPR